jgi:hypothetical protein
LQADEKSWFQARLRNSVVTIQLGPVTMTAMKRGTLGGRSEGLHDKIE